MGNLSTHFSREEFRCRCGCGYDTVDTELLQILEFIRQHYQKPVTITSGCRCKAHNESIGGSDNSQHIYGRAADFQVEDVRPLEVYELIDNIHPNKYGLGVYIRGNSGWVHIDSRTDSPARWEG